MQFVLKAKTYGHVISARTKTAKEAYAKAVDWHVAKQFTDVIINDGRKDYSIAEFSEVMALAEIAVTGRSFDSL